MASFSDRRADYRAAIDILPPEDGKAKVVRLRARRGDVQDAHFVPVPAAQPRRDRNHFQNDNRSTGSKHRSRKAGRLSCVVNTSERQLSRLQPDMFLALVAALFVAVFTLFGGFSLVSARPPAAETFPALDITHVTMTPQDASGMRVLLINGIVENRTGNKLAMPAIRADLLADETVLASTLITTEARHIGGRESYGFSARVPHPGGKMPDLRLSLAERGA
jgi:hypothetical protein